MQNHKSKFKMSERILVLVTVVSLAVSSSAAGYSGGTGEPNHPYRIATANDLNDIGNHVEDFNKCFVMVNDINLADYTGTQFNIIGDDTNPFTGVFDGNNCAILNFIYTGCDANFVGVFGYVATYDAEIKDLGLIDPNINGETSGGYVGSLVGYLDSASLTNCYVKHGSVCGGRDVSIGDSLYPTCVGGLVGAGQYGTVTKCYASGLVRGNAIFVGGLVGAYDGTVSNCSRTNTVSGNGLATGGLIGLSSGTISNCYATGAVDGNERTGGLVGQNFPGEISNCYAGGAVDGNDYTGGLVGIDWYGSYNKCFWDSDVNPGMTGIGNDTDPNVIAKSTTEMMEEATFTSWDFVEVWGIGENQTYPFLRVYPAGDLNHDGLVDWRDVAILANQWLGGEI